MLGGPVDAQGSRGAVEPLDVARVGRRQGAQQAHPAVDHQGRRSHPREQRDLGVPVLGRQLRAELEPPPLALDRDLLLGQRQRHAATGRLSRQTELTDLLEQEQWLLGGAVVDGLLDAAVAQLRPRPDARALDGDVGALAGRVDLDGPQQRWALLVGQQRGRALGDHRRVERDLGVGAVQGLPALVRLDVDGIARRDEGRQVRDGVVDDVAVALTRDVHGLVEVHRRGRVDGDHR